MTNEEWRNHRYYKFDPFAGEIPPALLNSVDIKRYVDKGCLIKEVDFDPENCLKPASYEMKFLGKLYDWKSTGDEKLKQRCREICRGSEITLHANSITYLWMKEELMLPQYIAARFNLHISHVHKGILLGTGPLVDPGFFGNLLIPLHNLTDNNYKFYGGEGIIWVEFTKLSGHEFWSNQKETENPHDLKSFPIRKDVSTPEEYFKRSDIRSSGVQSAFKGALEKAKKAAKSARKETDSFKNYYTWGGLATVLAIVISLAVMIVEGLSLVTQTIKITDDVRHQIKLDGDKQSQKIDSVKNDIADLEIRMTRYKDEVSELKKQVDLMKEKQEAGREIAQ